MSRLFLYTAVVPILAVLIFGAGLHYGISLQPKQCECTQLKKDVERLERDVNILITKQ
jgi:hypothetical protein